MVILVKKEAFVWLIKTTIVNVSMGVRGTGTVRLVRSTIGKMGPAQIAVKPETKTKNKKEMTWLECAE